jgi:uncharacterized zinc-type alcohol dehydrogenase-like protein
MPDFCGAYDIIHDIVMIRMDQINEAFDRVVAGGGAYRLAIDMTSLLPPCVITHHDQLFKSSSTVMISM